jgi:hypothetical protein
VTCSLWWSYSLPVHDPPRLRWGIFCLPQWSPAPVPVMTVSAVIFATFLASIAFYGATYAKLRRLDAR